MIPKLKPVDPLAGYRRIETAYGVMHVPVDPAGQTEIHGTLASAANDPDSSEPRHRGRKQSTKD